MGLGQFGNFIFKGDTRYTTVRMVKLIYFMVGFLRRFLTQMGHSDHYVFWEALKEITAINIKESF